MAGSGALAALRGAGQDVAAALARPWLWGALGWNDLRQRHAGSWLGPLWITANLALIVACLTFVFAGPLGGGDAHSYAAYVAIGLVLWQLIQASLNEGAQLFIAAAETIRNAPMPLTVHALRLIWRNALVLLHAAVLIPPLLLFSGVAPSATAWTALPALLLLLGFLFAASLLLGLLGARFRDVAPIVANLTQLLFFVTPIFWLPEALGHGRAWLTALNPFFAFVDIVRAPLLGEAPMAGSWPMALAAAVLAGLAGFAALAGARRRLPYWV
ncbi:MAG TPA: ABC transporter permease [Allosphingosinicella sp.]